MRVLALIVLMMALCAGFYSRAQELQDPTRPYLYESAPAEGMQTKGKVEWHLTGVQIRGDSRTAILNGQVVKVGDRIGDASVAGIEPWKVTLTEDYRQLTVNLLTADVKQKIGVIHKHE